MNLNIPKLNTTTTKTSTVTEEDTQEAVTALLTLGQEQMMWPNPENMETLPPVLLNLPENFMADQEPPGTDNETNITDAPTPIEVNVIINNPDTSEIKGQIIGTAVKIQPGDETSKTEFITKKDQPTLTSGKVTFKTYSLRKTKEERKFRCRVCRKIMTSVRDYNKHYNEHPPSHCNYCSCTFISPRTLARHLYSHKEIL